MSSIISGASNPMLWQQVLSQSNNVSYSARGVSRVQSTDPGRKADYWFRDFGMVMACSYMTELSFRIVDKFFTIPHLTDKLQLNRLSQMTKPGSKELLYPRAQNYSRMPSVFQNRMMGTLIKGSSDMVPKIMREMEDQKADNLDNGLNEPVKALLKNPLSAEANVRLDKALVEAGIKRAGIPIDAKDKLFKEFQELSNRDNKWGREKAIEQFLEKNPTISPTALDKAVTLETARQNGILMDHVQRTQNHKEYVINKYMDEKNGLKSLVPDFLKEYSEKVYNATEADKGALPKTIKEIWSLPPANRVDVFNKKFNEFKQHFFVRDGQTFLSASDLEKFNQLGDQFRAVFKKETKATRDELDPLLKEMAFFQKNLGSETPIGQAKLTQHVEKLASAENLAEELHGRLKKKLESTIGDVHKLIPGKNPQEEVESKVKDLKLHTFFDNASAAETKHVKPFIENLKKALPSDSLQSADSGQRAAIAKHISAFMTTLKNNGKKTEQKDADALLKRLLKPLLDAKKHPTGLNKDQLQVMVREALDSKLTAEAIKRIQSSSTWPKTFLTVAFNFVFYGLAASKFDNKVLQPYEKKLVDERGTSQDIVTSGYLALIPGLAVLTQLFDKTTPVKVIRRMGNLQRFSLVGGAALATFAASTYGILQHRLKTPPKNPPKPQAQAQGQARPGFAPATPNQFAAPQASPFVTGGFATGGLNRSSFNSFAPAHPVFPQFVAPRFSGQTESQDPRKLVRHG